MGLNRYFAALPLASAYGAVIAASATALALQARERSGVGDHIKVPLICAATEALAYTRRLKPQLLMDSGPSGYLLSKGWLQVQGRADVLRNLPRHHNLHTRRCLQGLGICDGLVAERLVRRFLTSHARMEIGSPSKRLAIASPLQTRSSRG